MMGSANRYDVLIVGAGLAGCATARALAEADPGRQRRILLIDSHKDVHPRFSGELIHPRGAQILADLGFGEALHRAGAVDVDGFVIFENADAHFVRLDYASVIGERPQGISVHHKTLVPVLRKVVVDSTHVELREECSIRELRRNERGHVVGAVIESADHTLSEIRCDVVVGADGKSSTVRKLAQISDDGRETIGFTAGIELTNAHLPRATYAHVILGAWGPVLAYPVLHEPDGSIRTRVTFDLPRVLTAKGPKLKEQLLRAYVPFLPAPLSVEVAAAIRAWPGSLHLAPTVNLPAPTSILPGLVLVGDAGGCSHPITASGMTMGLRDAETLGLQARKRSSSRPGEAWLDVGSLERYRDAHDRYVPTRQALADAIYEAFRGEREGSRAIRRALFQYWNSGPTARSRSMALLSCSEQRPSVFLTEYLKTARHALGSSFIPQHARHFPVQDRVRQARGAASLATNKFGLVAQVMWAQVRPSWFPRTTMSL